MSFLGDLRLEVCCQEDTNSYRNNSASVRGLWGSHPNWCLQRSPLWRAEQVMQQGNLQLGEWRSCQYVNCSLPSWHSGIEVHGEQNMDPIRRVLMCTRQLAYVWLNVCSAKLSWTKSAKTTSLQWLMCKYYKQLITNKIIRQIVCIYVYSFGSIQMSPYTSTSHPSTMLLQVTLCRRFRCHEGEGDLTPICCTATRSGEVGHRVELRGLEWSGCYEMVEVCSWRCEVIDGKHNDTVDGGNLKHRRSPLTDSSLPTAAKKLQCRQEGHMHSKSCCLMDYQWRGLSKTWMKLNIGWCSHCIHVYIYILYYTHCWPFSLKQPKHKHRIILLKECWQYWYTKNACKVGLLWILDALATSGPCTHRRPVANLTLAWSSYWVLIYLPTWRPIDRAKTVLKAKKKIGSQTVFTQKSAWNILEQRNQSAANQMWCSLNHLEWRETFR